MKLILSFLIVIISFFLTPSVFADQPPQHISPIKQVIQLQEDVAELQSQVAELKTLLNNVTRGIDPNTGYETIRFSGMNVQIVNGLGFTDLADGTGNLIIGYNEWRELEGSENLRDGSHMLVVGSQNNYTAESFGGIVVGTMNQTAANYASVSGGSNNYALNN